MSIVHRSASLTLSCSTEYDAEVTVATVSLQASCVTPQLQMETNQATQQLQLPVELSVHGPYNVTLHNPGDVPVHATVLVQGAASGYMEVVPSELVVAQHSKAVLAMRCVQPVPAMQPKDAVVIVSSAAQGEV